MTPKKNKPVGKKRTVMDSAPKFIEWVEKLEGRLLLYRGLADADWEVETSALRRLRASEKNFVQDVTSSVFHHYIESRLQEARSRGHGFQDGAELSDLELLAKLQHYGAATCLIDFTTNPLTALWFACNAPHKNGKVIAIRSDQTEKFNEISHEEMKTKKIQNFLSRKNLYKWKPAAKVDNRVLAQQSVFILGRPSIESRDYEEVEIDKKLGGNLEKYGVTEQSLFPDFPGFALSNAHDKTHTESSAEDYYYLGVKAQQKGDNIYALEYYDKSIQINSQDADAYNNRGATKYYLRDYRGAIKDFNEAIQLNPKFSDPYSNRGTAKSDLGDHRGALEDHDKAIRLNPMFFGAYYNRGSTKAQLKDHRGALEDFDKAIRLNPQHAEAYCNRGAAKDYLGNHLGAIEDFDEAIRLNPQNVNAYNNRGVARKNLGNDADAKEDFKKANELKMA